MIKEYEIKLEHIRPARNTILALGGHLKCSLCLLHGKTARMIEFPENLDRAETVSSYEQEVKKMLKREKIEIVACDMHPDYFSTKLAEELVSKNKNLKLIKVQHHYAHMASCMADNDIKEKVLGVSFDGTGYGLDGNIWGAEFLAGDFKGFKRVGYFDYAPMPGGEMAIKEPWRMACSYLYKIYGEDFTKLKIDFVKRLNKRKWKIIKKMIDSKINSPLASSVGRLFDAVSSLCGIRDKVKFEGQAAIELEKSISHNIDSSYSFGILNKNGSFIVRFDKMFKQIIKDLIDNKDVGIISCKFHNTMAEAILAVAKKAKLKNVVLSGGVFQNKYLLDRTKQLLFKNNFKVYTHHMVPTNDLGISLGQAVTACA